MQTFTKQVAHPATLVFANRRPTFEEAKSICRGKVSSYKSYYAFRKNNPQYNLPSQPMVYYKTEWTNIYEFLAIYPSARSEGVRKYWADVKSGVRTRTLPSKKKKNSNKKNNMKENRITKEIEHSNDNKTKGYNTLMIDIICIK